MRPLVKLALAAVVVAASSSRLRRFTLRWSSMQTATSRSWPRWRVKRPGESSRSMAISRSVCFRSRMCVSVRHGCSIRRVLTDPLSNSGLRAPTWAAAAAAPANSDRRALVDGLHLRLLKNRKGENNWPDPFANKREDSKDGKRSEFRFTAFGFLVQLSHTEINRRRTNFHCPKSN